MMKKLNPRLVAKLRALGKMVSAVRGQIRSMSEARQTARDYRLSVNEKVKLLEAKLPPMQRRAEAYGAPYRAEVAEVLSEIEDLKKEIQESLVEEESLLEQARELSEFIGTNEFRLRDALEALGIGFDDLGIAGSGRASVPRGAKVIQA